MLLEMVTEGQTAPRVWTSEDGHPHLNLTFRSGNGIESTLFQLNTASRTSFLPLPIAYTQLSFSHTLQSHNMGCQDVLKRKTGVIVGDDVLAVSSTLRQLLLHRPHH